MRFLTSSISRRVTFAFAAVLLVVAGLGLVSMNRLNAVNEKAVLMRDDYVPSIEALAQIRADLFDMRNKTARVVIGGEAQFDDASAQYEDSRQKTAKGAEDYVKLVDKG